MTEMDGTATLEDREAPWRTLKDPEGPRRTLKDRSPVSPAPLDRTSVASSCLECNVWPPTRVVSNYCRSSPSRQRRHIFTASSGFLSVVEVNGQTGLYTVVGYIRSRGAATHRVAVRSRQSRVRQDQGQLPRLLIRPPDRWLLCVLCTSATGCMDRQLCVCVCVASRSPL